MNPSSDLNCNTTKPLKSILKKRPPPPESESDDEEIIFNDFESSDEDIYFTAEEEPYLESEYVYKKNGICVADYRKSNTAPKTDESRKEDLGLFYPSDSPSPNYAQLRYEGGEKFRQEMVKLAWEGSASSQKVSKFLEKRKEIDTEAIRAKYSKEAFRSAKKEPFQDIIFSFFRPYVESILSS